MYRSLQLYIEKNLPEFNIPMRKFEVIKLCDG